MVREMVTEIDPWIALLIGVRFVHTRWEWGAELGMMTMDMAILCQLDIASKGHWLRSAM